MNRYQISVSQGFCTLELVQIGLHCSCCSKHVCVCVCLCVLPCLSVYLQCIALVVCAFYPHVATNAAIRGAGTVCVCVSHIPQRDCYHILYPSKAPGKTHSLASNSLQRFGPLRTTNQFKFHSSRLTSQVVL